jgi:hypothetical protein
MNPNQQQDYNNYTMLKALEQTDASLVKQVISDPDLDGKELTKILEIGIMGSIVNKTTGEPLKLSNEVLMAGFRNRLNQMSAEAERDGDI